MRVLILLITALTITTNAQRSKETCNTDKKQNIMTLNVSKCSIDEDEQTDQKILRSRIKRKTTKKLRRFGDLNKKNIYTIRNVDYLPVFRGCENKSVIKQNRCFKIKLLNHIAKHSDELIGKSMSVRFIVRKSGKVTNIVSRNNSIVRVMNKLPKLKPAIKNNKPVHFYYNVTINVNK